MKFILMLVFIAFFVTLVQSPSVIAQKVSIVTINTPTKVYDEEPFTVTVDLQPHQAGGFVRIVLSMGGVKEGEAKSNLILDYGPAVNLAIDNIALAMNAQPYPLTLDAYWDAALGGSSKEDSRTLSIISVGSVFAIDYDSITADSGKTFNFSIRVTNNGNDVARSVVVELTGLSGLTANGPLNISLNDVEPGRTKSAVFQLTSSWTDVNQGPRGLVFNVVFEDWRGHMHSQSLSATVFVRISFEALTYWSTIAIVVLAVILFVLFKAGSIRLGPLSASK